MLGRLRVPALCALLLLSLAPVRAGGMADDHACVNGRQTEDPLSPPCAPAFTGGNDGATWPGVTGEEIRVVLYNDLGISGDMTLPYKPDEEIDQTSFQYRNLVRTVKAHLGYFAHHFQTWGRRVRLIAYPSLGGLATHQAQRRGDAIVISQDLEPFAVVALVGDASEFYALMAEFGIPTLGALYHVPRRTYLDHGSYVWSLMPDQETEVDWNASYLCEKLAGLPARFTSDPLLKGRTRSFGLLYQRQSQRGPYMERMGKLLHHRVAARCGLDFEVVHGFLGNGQDTAIALSQMKAKMVTTVVCLCIPQQTELTVPFVQTAATAIGYQPEWFWGLPSPMDNPIWQRLYGSRVQKGFGLTPYWRVPALHEQFHYRAYLEQAPATSPNVRWSFDIYHSLQLLFTAIQESGTTLTPGNIGTGLAPLALRRPKDPFVPGGGFEPTKTNPYTFIDNAMAWWWDPTGPPPGGTELEGCMRMVRRGLRSRPGTWAGGDMDLFVPSDPCSGPPIGIIEP